MRSKCNNSAQIFNNFCKSYIKLHNQHSFRFVVVERVKMDFDEVPKIVVEPPGPKAKAIIEKNVKYYSSLAMGISRIMQIVYDEARGAVIKDVDGNYYIDFTAAVTCANTGHNHPKIVEAIKEQVERFITSYEYPTEVRAEAAKLLVEATPGNFEKAVIFVNSGAESNERATQIAEYYTKKHEFISFWESFHGKSRMANSLTTYGLKMRKGLSKHPGIYHVPYPNCYRCPLRKKYPDCDMACLDFLDHVYTYETTDDVAAVILEPILGGGAIVPPKDYWNRVKEWADDHNALFIDDEVQVGFGRTGKMFAIEHWGLEPEILTGGKGLASGLPAGSVVVKKSIADEISEYRGLFTSTFGGNPLIMAAAAASLKVYKEEKLPERAAELGEHALKRLNEIKDKYDFISYISGKGLIICVDFVKDEKWTPAPEIALKVVEKSFKKGLLIFTTAWRGNNVKINPPLVITKELLDKGIDILDEVFAEIKKEM